MSKKEFLKMLREEIPRMKVILNREPQEIVELTPFIIDDTMSPQWLLSVMESQSKKMEPYKGRILDIFLMETEDGKFQYQLAVAKQFEKS